MIQFLLPLLVAGIANAAIYCKLKVDIVNTFTFIDDKADIDMGAWRLLWLKLNNVDQWMMIIKIVQTFSSNGFCLAFVLNEAWTTVFVQFGADKKPIQDVSVSDSIKKV